MAAGNDKSKDLFELPADEAGQFSPLADRMRPLDLDEFVGQEHILGEGGVLRRMIETDRLSSMIFWGPPGTGKTTLARIIAGRTGSRFIHRSAVTCGVAQVKETVKEAAEQLKLYRRRTIMFLDEIHRFNKTQQDALLPHVEHGTITLVGATTENPSFQVNSALLSRVRVFVLKPLSKERLGELVDRALADSDRGLGDEGVVLSGDARDLLLRAADGDARAALSGLELAALYHRQRIEDGGDTGGAIDEETMRDALQQRMLRYDRQGDEHYDVISAFIKSLRGSDADAALYWMARMIEAGEDPLFICRRMVIFAAEDIGNADPQALQTAVATHQAVAAIGLPEGAIPISQAVCYLATAPKSNASYLALKKSTATAKEHMTEPVPLHLRNAPTRLMKELGYAEGYKYPHDFPYHFTPQQHLPDALAGKKFYEPTGLGFEKEIVKRIEFWDKLKKEDGKKAE